MIRSLIVGLAVSFSACAGFASGFGGDALASAVAPPTAAEPERYDGEINAMGQKLRFVLVLTRGEPASATIAIPEQGLKATPVTKLVLDKNKLSCVLAFDGAPPAAFPSFDIDLADGGQSGTGTMTQGGQKFPVTVKRLAAGEQAGPKRPQNPVGPLPYTSREVLVLSSDGAKLPGTLTIPEEKTFGKGPHACALLITGSGVQDRDESLMGHKPFLVLSDRLTRAGVAVLRVDDRGFAGNFDPLKGNGTTETFVLDARACVEFLRTQSDIDPKRIGLIGHSEGGLIAPMLAAQDADKVAFVVMLAGTGVSGKLILCEQSMALVRAEGVAPEKLAAIGEKQIKLFNLVESAAESQAIEAAIGELTREQLQATGQKLDEAQVKQVIDMGVKQLTSPWMRTFISLDPAPSLAKVRCPVLALNGALDMQVLAAQNIGPIATALTQGGNTDVTIAVLPGLNHLFQPCKTGALSEYEKIETTMDEGMLSLVTGWVVKRTEKPARLNRRENLMP